MEHGHKVAGWGGVITKVDHRLGLCNTGTGKRDLRLLAWHMRLVDKANVDKVSAYFSSAIELLLSSLLVIR